MDGPMAVKMGMELQRFVWKYLLMFYYVNVFQEMYEKLRNEFEKVQQLYSEALDKMSALQIELEIQNGTCSECKSLKDKRQIDGSTGNVNRNIIKKKRKI